MPPERVIAPPFGLYQVEKSLRVSKSALRAGPVFHHIRESIDAHLTIVFTAFAASKLLEGTARWSIRKLVITLRRSRTIQIELSA